jgi:hypothetical protein
VRGLGPRPGRATAPAAATLVANAADADLDPAFAVLCELADGHAPPLPVLFVTEPGGDDGAERSLRPPGHPRPRAGQAPAIEALQVLPGNHRSVVEAHLLTAVRVILPTGGPRASALRAAFAETSVAGRLPVAAS